jgi:septin family protein
MAHLRILHTVLDKADCSCNQASSGPESNLPFTTTVMLLGISGSGKSSVINSLLGRQACNTDAFGLATKKVPPLLLLPLQTYSPLHADVDAISATKTCSSM